MISGGEGSSPEEDECSSDAETPTIGNKGGFLSQQSGMKPPASLIAKKNNNLMFNEFNSRPGSVLRLNTASATTNNNDRFIIGQQALNSTRSTAQNYVSLNKLNLNKSNHGSGPLRGLHNIHVNNFEDDPMYQLLMSDVSTQDFKANLI